MGAAYYVAVEVGECPIVIFWPNYHFKNETLPAGRFTAERETQVQNPMIKLSPAWLAAAAFVVGGIVGGWVVSIISNHFANSFMTTAASADTITTVRTLEQLRRGNTTGAVELLELELDGSLIELGAWMQNASPSQQDSLDFKTIQNAKDYRAKFPRTNGHPQIVEGVARTFRLLNSSQQQ